MYDQCNGPSSCHLVLYNPASTACVCSRAGVMDDEGDEAYFDAYDDVGTHELMLKDAPRMNAYCAAIEANKDFIRGRVVLDVGAGTGVLSLLAARAGAARVYAVEASGIVVELQKIVSQNGFGDVITVLHGRAEDVELPEQVDVCVSEWMARLYAARRQWLHRTRVAVRCYDLATGCTH